MTIPEQAVQAACARINELGKGNNVTIPNVVEMLTAAAPHLAAVRVNSDQIEAARKAVEELANTQMNLPLEDWLRISSAILSALEPSAARELALEALRSAEQFIENGFEFGFIRKPDEGDTALETLPKIKAAIRALSSPDHADAGKVEGDGIERTEFNRGYVLACANIVNLHGADVAVMEGFAQLGISKAELKALDLCEYDQRAIDALEDYFGADKLYRTSALSEGAE